MPRLQNPYIVGTPIPKPDDFFGRESLLAFVRDTLNPPQQRVVALYGQRRIGKTSVLLELRRRLADDYHPIYFDLMGQANRPLTMALYEVADQIADVLGVIPPHEFTEPRQFRQYLEIICDDLPNGKPLLLLLDEFDDLSKEDAVEPNVAALTLFEYLRDLLNIELQVAFVFVVGRRLTELPQNFQSILKQAPSRRVGYLSPEDARALITSPAEGELTFDETAVTHIINLTSGHPYFIQLICFELFRRYGRIGDSHISRQDVEAVLESAIETGQGGLSWFWDALPPTERFIMSAIAEAGQDSGTATLEDVNRILEAHRVSFLGYDMVSSPTLLVQWEILQYDNYVYRFSVDLVRRWISLEHPIAQAVTEVEEISPRAKRYFENAVDAHRSGEMKLAIDDYERAIKANPNHYRAQLGLAQAMEEVGDQLAAHQAYKRAYEMDAERTRTSLANSYQKLAEADERAGDLEQAIDRFKQANALLPSGTRQLQISSLVNALQAQREKRQTLLRRARYGLSIIVGLIALFLAISFLLPPLQAFITSLDGTDTTNAVPTAVPGTPQIIISSYDQLQEAELSPAAQLEVALPQAFPDIKFIRETAVLSRSDALDMLNNTGSAAIIYGTYSNTTAVTYILFNNEIEYAFSLQYEDARVVDSSGQTPLATLGETTIEQMTTYRLNDLATAVATDNSGLVSYLAGRLYLLAAQDIARADDAIGSGIDAGYFKPLTTRFDQTDVSFVPSGDFEMGRSTAEMMHLCQVYKPDCDQFALSASQPVNTIFTDAYLIDLYEVTNGQYGLCVAAGKCDPPSDSGSSTRASYFDSDAFITYPVVNVSWDSAQDYCDWRNGRLPTQAEWEKAAHWSPVVGMLTYPWGNEDPQPAFANYSDSRRDTVAVGASLPSPFGLYDMAGNVWEWTQDTFEQAYYQTIEPNNPENSSGTSNVRVIRGGAHFSDAFGLTVIDPAYQTSHETSGNMVTGFRCVYDDLP